MKNFKSNDFEPKMKVMDNRVEARRGQGFVLYNRPKSFEAIGVPSGFEMFIQNLEFKAGLVHPNSLSIGPSDGCIKSDPLMLRCIIVPHDMPKHWVGLDLVKFFSVSVNIP